MNRYLALARTVWRLGLRNVLRLIGYRLGIRFRWNRATRLHAAVAEGKFFDETNASARAAGLEASEAWRGEGVLFGWKRLRLSDEPPRWHGDREAGSAGAVATRPWWQIPDFDPEHGDIKLVWELSRMHWLLPMAQRAALGDATELARANRWLRDWCMSNPPYFGRNWKCGQEAAIRVLHLATAALLLGAHAAPARALLDLVRAHLERILPTMSYARAQDNNHGTSEAAALFIGGAWLHSLGDTRAARIMNLGRRTLEERVLRLVAADGSFSQYSVMYHRLLLDTLCVAEVWRRCLGLPRFSESYTARCAQAARWLRAMTDETTGMAPNIGANDGANLVPLARSEHNDMRPTVQVAYALFAGSRAYEGEGPWNATAQWLKVALPQQTAPGAGSTLFDEGGYALLCAGAARAYVRFPRFRFRPSHADALHVDLWVAGENVLRDGGSYSYAAGREELDYFAGTESHNTVQFDDRDQMIRLGRFLFGDWLGTEARSSIESRSGCESFSAAYRDRFGARHARHVSLEPRSLRVIDEISEFRAKAVLRWRLVPGDWHLRDNGARNASYALIVRSSVPIKRIQLTSGWESRFYLKRDALPVLEVEVDRPATLESTLSWSG
jgi:hypothetical protein